MPVLQETQKRRDLLSAAGRILERNVDGVQILAGAGDSGGAGADENRRLEVTMDKEHTAIERINLASEMSLRHYGKPLVCTYSGGKDSEVVLELFKRSGIPFEVHNSHTTADAPPRQYDI